MRICTTLAPLVSVLAVSVAVTAQQPAAPAEIVSPPGGGLVSTEDQVTIRMLKPGVPIVAVRAKEEGSHWWIQQLAAPLDSRRFVFTARFGNETTPAGTRFLVTTLIAKDQRAAASLRTGMSMEELPEDMVHIDAREVVVGRLDRQPPTFRIEMLEPRPGGNADWIQKVTLKTSEPSSEIPRLVVRFAGEQSWWVQESMRRVSGGRLVGVAQIGNRDTIPGSQFMLMLVYPKNDVAREMLSTGTVLKDLSEFRCSRSFTVTRLEAPDDESDLPAEI